MKLTVFRHKKSGTWAWRHECDRIGTHGHISEVAAFQAGHLHAEHCPAKGRR